MTLLLYELFTGQFLYADSADAAFLNRLTQSDLGIVPPKARSLLPPGVIGDKVVEFLEYGLVRDARLRPRTEDLSRHFFTLFQQVGFL